MCLVKNIDTLVLEKKVGMNNIMSLEDRPVRPKTLPEREAFTFD